MVLTARGVYNIIGRWLHRAGEGAEASLRMGLTVRLGTGVRMSLTASGGRR